MIQQHQEQYKHNKVQRQSNVWSQKLGCRSDTPGGILFPIHSLHPL